MGISQESRIYVAGHRGLVGSAVVRLLQQQGHNHLLTAPKSELDLCDPAAVSAWFQTRKPQIVIHAAGVVGGILANATHPVTFLHDNVLMVMNVLRAAWETGVEKLLYLGSSCIYPRDCPQPIREEYLLTSPLERTNEAYALAKIAGVKACDAYRTEFGCHFISAMPTNLYGPCDNFDLQTAHVLPAMIRRFHEAKRRGESRVRVWGSGKPRREFLHVDDLASACLFLLERYDEPGPINVGTGEDIPIQELAQLIRDIVHPSADIEWDATKPDGTPRKLLDVSRLNGLGWRPRIAFRAGVKATYQWYLEHEQNEV